LEKGRLLGQNMAEKKQKKKSDIDAKKAVGSGWGKAVPVAYNSRDLILYALGTGACDLRYTHENHEKFAALPWYPVVLNFKGDSFDTVTFPTPAMIDLGAHVEGGPLPMGPVLDGERYVEALRPLPTNGELLLKQRVLGVHDKKTGALMETESILFDKNGTNYMKIISGAFFVGVSGFDSFGETNSVKLTIPNRPPDKVVEQATSPLQAHIYRLSGDYNPLHIDPDMAVTFGFKKPILHGLCSFGHSARHVLEAYGDNDPARFKAVKVRFSKPVDPGQTLVTEMWKEGDRVYFQTKVKETGKVCMDNCYMDLVGPKARL